jgi:nitrite reductase (NAD(P)H)
MTVSPPRSPVRSLSTLVTEERDASQASSRTRVFVVGLGMVGLAFIEKMLSQDEQGRYKIITVGEETHLAYNRVGLTDFFLHRKIDELYLNQPE